MILLLHTDPNHAGVHVVQWTPALHATRTALCSSLLQLADSPEHKYTLAFMAYGEENNSTVIELTYNYGRKEYNKGNAYAQVRTIAYLNVFAHTPLYSTTMRTRRYGPE